MERRWRDAGRHAARPQFCWTRQLPPSASVGTIVSGLSGVPRAKRVAGYRPHQRSFKQRIGGAERCLPL